MIPIIVWGAAGRMGGKILSAIKDDKLFRLSGAIETAGHHVLGADAYDVHSLGHADVPICSDLADIPGRGVIIDFSLPGGPALAAAFAKSHRWGLVSGTTGLSQTDTESLSEASKTVPVLHSPNFSIGIQLMLKFVEISAQILPETFDSGIIETHHVAKKDKPSGTALAFAKRILDSGPGSRRLETLSLRMAQVIGEHDIRFCSPSEEITLSHRALNRDLFVAGALKAAEWIFEQSAGMYQFKDALGIS